MHNGPRATPPGHPARLPACAPCALLARPAQVKEPSLESLARGKTVYEPPRFMTVGTAIEQLLEVEAQRGEGAYDSSTMCVGVARLGSDTQQIVAGGMRQLLDVDFGAPLHSLVIAGTTHPVEDEILERFTSVTL